MGDSCELPTKMPRSLLARLLCLFLAFAFSFTIACNVHSQCTLYTYSACTVHVLVACWCSSCSCHLHARQPSLALPCFTLLSSLRTLPAIGLIFIIKLNCHQFAYLLRHKSPAPKPRLAIPSLLFFLSLPPSLIDLLRVSHYSPSALSTVRRSLALLLVINAQLSQAASSLLVSSLLFCSQSEEHKVKTVENSSPNGPNAQNVSISLSC